MKQLKELKKLKQSNLIKVINEETYEEIINLYSKKLNNYVLNLVNYNQGLVKDIVQDIFYKVWLYKDKYNSNTNNNINAWIYRIAHNETLNLIKRNNNTYYSEGLLEYSYSIEDNIKERIELKAKRELINDNIRNHKSNNKNKVETRLKVFNLLFEGYTNKEIGRKLNKTTNCIGLLVMREKNRLKESIKNVIIDSI